MHQTDLRELGKAADFLRLVQAARSVIAAGSGDSDAGCLLARAADGHRLAADLLPSIRPLPDPPKDLDVMLSSGRGPTRLLSAWGQSGTGEPDAVLALFTTTGASSANASSAGLFITDHGVYLRHSEAQAKDEGPVDYEAVIPRLLEEPIAVTLAVTAEAAIPVTELERLLNLVPNQFTVALAVVLEEGTRPPQEPERTTPAALRCPDGLPEPSAQAVEGALPRETVRKALGPLTRGAMDCLSVARGKAAAGGNLTLAIRFGEAGAAETLCLVEDGPNDAMLSACIIETARSLRLPAPDPPGFVDVHVPLDLQPAGTTLQHPLCAAAPATGGAP